MGFKKPLKHKQLSDVSGSLGSHGFGIYPFAVIGAPIDCVTNTIIPEEARIHCLPLYIPRSVIVNGIQCKVIAPGGTAGAVARLGIYSGDPTPGAAFLGGPGKLILDAGTVATNSGGDRSIDVPQMTLDEGVYWLAYVAQGTPATRATVRCATGQHPFIGAGPSTVNPIGGCLSGAPTHAGALPDPFGGGSYGTSRVVATWLKMVKWL